MNRDEQRIHIILLTAGEGDYFMVDRVYLSDHPINKDEWSDEMQAFNKRVSAFRDDAYIRHGGRWGYGHIPAAHAEYIAYIHETHPLPAFIEKHGLQPVEHTELWSWGHE